MYLIKTRKKNKKNMCIKNSKKNIKNEERLIIKYIF